MPIEEDCMSQRHPAQVMLILCTYGVPGLTVTEASVLGPIGALGM